MSSAIQSCGSGLARESGVSVDIIGECQTAFASKPAPTGFVVLLRFVLLGCALLLSACASRAPLPEHSPTLALPLQLHIQRLMADQRQDWVLVIQQEGPGLRWSMMDLLGIPQARQKLIDGELHSNYPTASQHGGQRVLPERWDVRYSRPLSFELNLPKGPKYQVTPLSADTP